MSSSLPIHGLYSPWHSPGQNTGVGCLSLLQGIFPTQGSNPGLCIAGGFFTNWAPKEALHDVKQVFYPYFHIGKLALCDMSWFFLCTSACRLWRKVSTSKFSTLPNISLCFAEKCSYNIRAQTAQNKSYYSWVLEKLHKGILIKGITTTSLNRCSSSLV